MHDVAEHVIPIIFEHLPNFSIKKNVKKCPKMPAIVLDFSTRDTF